MLTACNSQPSSNAGGTTPPANNTNSAGDAQTPDDNNRDTSLEGEITFWHSFTQGPRLETIQAAADAFTEANPGVKITIETFSWADFYTKWTTGLASGNVPDMSTALSNHVVEMIDAEAIIPMDNLINSMGRDRFYEAPLTEMTAPDGQCYAVPIYSHAQVMWYHKDLLDKYDLEVPTTWDELYEAAKKISDGEGGNAYGTSVPMGTNDMMATRFLNFYVLDQATLYYTGKICFDFNAAFQISGVEVNAPELLDQIDCAPMPTINKGDPQVGYETSNIPMVIWKNSDHPEICEAFIKFLYEPENYVPFLLSVPVGMLPALKEISTDPTFLSDPTVQKFSNTKDVINKAVGEGTAIGMESGPRPEAGLLTSQGVIESMFQDIIINGTDVETAAAAAEAKLNDLFSTPGLTSFAQRPCIDLKSRRGRGLAPAVPFERRRLHEKDKSVPGKGGGLLLHPARAAGGGPVAALPGGVQSVLQLHL